jgi:hypothetical protein
MVSKKNIIDEMKKFNDDLDKHLPHLSTESLLNKEAFQKSSDNNEMLTLLASNMVDLRTELNLMRKNIVGDMHSMMMKLVSDEQKIFMEQINNVYTKSLVEIKQNFGSYITSINEEIVEVRKEFNKIARQGDNLKSNFENFSEIMSNFSSTLSEFDKNMSNPAKEINEQLKNLNLNLKDSSFHLLDINEKNHEELAKELTQIKEKEQKIDDKLKHISEHHIVGIKENYMQQTSSIEDSLQIVSKKLDKLVQINQSIKKLTNEVEGLPVDDKYVRSISRHVSGIDNKLSDIEGEQKEIITDLNISNINAVSPQITVEPTSRDIQTSARVKKILDIDEKLKKLNSLR